MSNKGTGVRWAAVTLAVLVWLLWVLSSVQASELDAAVAAAPIPRLTDGGWVADPAEAIGARQGDINGLVAAFEAETGVEIAVVVLPSIRDLAPKAFAIERFNFWWMGKKGKDNGILVLQILDQRRVEIETGYAMEGILRDVKCHWIVEDIVIPFSKAGSFSDGHYEIARALVHGIRVPVPTGRSFATTSLRNRASVSIRDPPTMNCRMRARRGRTLTRVRPWPSWPFWRGRRE